MIILKLIVNILILLFGVFVLKSGIFDIKREIYPKWIGISEIILGIAGCIYSFTIWFMV